MRISDWSSDVCSSDLDEFATGFKASSINLSRDSRPLESDLPAIGAAGLTTPNLVGGTRFAGPEESEVYEFGLKGQWSVAALNLAVFKQSIKGFQSNIFTGTGFALANAGKQSTWGVEFDGSVRPVDGLNLTLAMTWLNPKYDSFVGSAFGDISGTKDRKSTRLNSRHQCESRMPSS